MAINAVHICVLTALALAPKTDFTFAVCFSVLNDSPTYGPSTSSCGSHDLLPVPSLAHSYLACGEGSVSCTMNPTTFFGARRTDRGGAGLDDTSLGCTGGGYLHDRTPTASRAGCNASVLNSAQMGARRIMMVQLRRGKHQRELFEEQTSTVPVRVQLPLSVKSSSTGR